MNFTRAIILNIFFVTFLTGSLSAQFQKKNYTQKILETEQRIEMIFIEEGIFLMGSEEKEWGHRPDESPTHNVNISAFWMSDAEITWDLYNLFVSRELDSLEMSSTKCKEVYLKPDAVTGAKVPYVDMSFGMGVNGFPAISMTQLAATRFCQWLSALTGHIYRLPTEAEWEYDCSAGSTTYYSFGNDL